MPNSGTDGGQAAAATTEEKGTPAAGSEGAGKADDKGSKGPDFLDPGSHTPGRRGAASFIIERKQKKIEKLQATDGEEGDDNSEDESEELSPEAEELIDQHLQPVVQGLKTQADEREIKDYLTEHPEHKKYERLARKYGSDPAYAQTPYSFIFSAIAGMDPSNRTNTAAKAQADGEAKENELGGGSARDGGEGELPDAFSLTDEQFEAQKNKVLNRGGKKR